MEMNPPQPQKNREFQHSLQYFLSGLSILFYQDNASTYST
jgi:hypothetical protein